MNGFEYQVAGHMLWEGLLEKGLAITRAVHDRYHPSRRNPWNEVECGDHYARSMASYGVFLAACGFEYHGPHGHLGFAPRLAPADFRAAFTAADAWGAFQQRLTDATLVAELTVRWGTLRLRTLALSVPAPPHRVDLKIGDRTIAATYRYDQPRLLIELAAEQDITLDDPLRIAVS
jgi:hypothetical protein